MHWDCIAHDKHTCAMHWDCMLTIRIVVQCIGIIAYDKHCAMHKNYIAYDKDSCAMHWDCIACDKHKCAMQ